MNPVAFHDAGIAQDMFHLGLPIAEKLLRPVIVYFALVILLRLFGKRELAQLNPFDLVVLLSLSNTVQNAMIGDDNSVTGGLAGAFALLLVNYLVVRFLFKHRRLDQIVEGKPTALIEKGKLCNEGLAKEMLTESELLNVAHRQGFGSLAELEECILEPGGTFFLKGKQPRAADRHQKELIARLDLITAQLDALKQQIKAR
ncbi:MAG TPA: YetF domain-containing protein [Blastocatellia bacterium]|nr:YetF domain-containing protein [Blastocatellia bacterium]